MPLGDPNGADFEYTDEGLPGSIFAVTIPVTDLGRSEQFYTETLGMGILGRTGDALFLKRGSCRIILKKSKETGIDTGLFLEVDNPYDTRRRFMDEGVRFAVDPVRGPLGTFTSFYDPDDNILSVIEAHADFRP